MKQKLFFVIFAFLVAITVHANGTEINGIYYELDSSTKTASVTYTGIYFQPNPRSTAYTGNIAIPASVTYDGTVYSVTAIGDYAFYGCTGLTSITIPASVTTIGDDAFWGCTGLTSINLPASVTSIGDYAFYGCTGLTSISIPNSVTTIGAWTFDGCTGLTSISIPASVTSIGNYAFSACSGLASIKVEAGNTAYDSRENCNAIIETASNTLITGCMNTTIPNSVTSIGERAFYGCTSLTSISIPESVTSIGERAFSDCTGLTDIYARRTDPAAYNCSASAFNKVRATLHVPIDSKEAYAATAPWSDFMNIVEYDASGIETIGLTPSEADATSYYNLQGQRIARPQRGQIVIQRNADGTGRKVLVK